MKYKNIHFTPDNSSVRAGARPQQTAGGQSCSRKVAHSSQDARGRPASAGDLRRTSTVLYQHMQDLPHYHSLGAQLQLLSLSPCLCPLLGACLARVMALSTALCGLPRGPGLPAAWTWASFPPPRPGASVVMAKWRLSRKELSCVYYTAKC